MTTPDLSSAPSFTTTLATDTRTKEFRGSVRGLAPCDSWTEKRFLPNSWVLTFEMSTDTEGGAWYTVKLMLRGAVLRADGSPGGRRTRRYWTEEDWTEWPDWARQLVSDNRPGWWMGEHAKDYQAAWPTR